MLAEARRLHGAARLDEAAACYKQALHAQPANVEAWQGWGFYAPPRATGWRPKRCCGAPARWRRIWPSCIAS